LSAFFFNFFGFVVVVPNLGMDSDCKSYPTPAIASPSPVMAILDRSLQGIIKLYIIEDMITIEIKTVKEALFRSSHYLNPI
jgi:hypothetical protein